MEKPVAHAQQVLRCPIPTQSAVDQSHHRFRADFALGDELAKAQRVVDAHIVLPIIGHLGLLWGRSEAIQHFGIAQVGKDNTVTVPVAQALQVARSSGGGGIVDGHVDKTTWIVVGHLHAFDVDGECFRAVVHLLCCRSHAVGQQVAYPLAAGNHFDQGDDRLGVAPGQVEVTGLRRGEQALLVGFHGKGDDAGSRDGIQAIGVARLVDFGDALEVIVEEIAAKAGQRFVLWAVTTDASIRPVLDLDLFAAADGAGEAGGVFDPDGLVDALARDALGAFPFAQPPVGEGQVAILLGGYHTACCAKLAHADRVFFDG